MITSEPIYLKSQSSGALSQKAARAGRLLECCQVCPRHCKVNRLVGEKGRCQTGAKAMVSSFGPHFGEEACLVGSGGSGAIFFTNCNLGCLFCQNYEISHNGQGREVSAEELADIMLTLQERGCHNINLVTPSHVVPQILAAVETAARQGLQLPLVYNTGAYDSVESLRMLDGVIDIYMPDFKFWDERLAEIHCEAPDYPEVARQSILEMHRQVGDLVIDSQGLARHGLLVRHLVLPFNLASTREVIKFIVQNISPNTYVNIMSQFRPCGRSAELPELSRMISKQEYQAALQAAKEEGLTRLDSC